MHFIRVFSHKFSGVAASIASSIIILTSSAIAQVQIPGLYTTGEDDNGNTLPLGSFDPHYIEKKHLTLPRFLSQIRLVGGFQGLHLLHPGYGKTPMDSPQ
jgi:hypothetical protein